LTSALKGKLPGVACLNIVGTEGFIHSAIEVIEEDFLGKG
jgi:hypothetical protein